MPVLGCPRDFGSLLPAQGRRQEFPRQPVTSSWGSRLIPMTFCTWLLKTGLQNATAASF